jgi:hypothetical protein
MDDLKERLRKVEGSVEYGADPGGTVTCWHRNPDGLEALAHIEALEQRVSELEEERAELRKIIAALGYCAEDASIESIRMTDVVRAALAKARNEQVKQ